MHELRALVIIPAFNEEANILDTVSSVEEAGYDYVVINDGSTDDTLRVCRDAGVNVPIYRRILALEVRFKPDTNTPSALAMM